MCDVPVCTNQGDFEACIGGTKWFATKIEGTDSKESRVRLGSGKRWSILSPEWVRVGLGLGS